MLELIVKALLIWFGILILAIVNGTLREAVLIPVFGKFSGFILSGALLSIFILAVTYFTLPWFGAPASKKYFAIGFGWLLLTLVFEFTFGHFLQNKSWPQLFEAYAFKNGNIWPIVLLITAVAPYLAAKVRGLI